jgi:hypothetical protein
MKSSGLSLHEEVLLLALRDDKGTFSSSVINFPLAGAMMAELLLLGRIRVDEESRRKLVDLKDRRPTGDPLLDEGLRKIEAAKRRASLKSWVMRFARLKRLKYRVAEGLCRKGILRAEEGKILLLFKRTLYPEIDPRPERALIDRLRRTIFRDEGDLSPRTAILVSIANGADLLKISFDKKELRRRKKRIRQISAGEVTGKATRDAIEAMQAAVMVAVIFPAVIASSSSSG